MTMLLDNPIWSALSGPHAALSLGDERARRYDPDFTSLAAVAPGADLSALDAIASLGTIGICTTSEPHIPVGWQVLEQFAVAQMVCDKLIDRELPSYVILADADVPEMTELVKLTRPGPFARRTREFGTFIGIRDQGRLVAMAGERMKIDGHDEVSAVCTHPDYQGRGYARGLVSAVAREIVNRGRKPFLHVRSANLAGIRSYQSVGFALRTEFCFTVLKHLGPVAKP
ncbi:MAG: GNAT family N-acetyltransferase [Candidatus Obscuribacter sp.]|jgi:predicted GNAT family acetyltransferase|nr:GNAT family N-acetyltransferase [Candidatus Obscuribacter sp.]MDQ5965903.1 family N-acetyltransferase [Cyanobacteriota bacterium erpe_2018_sw_39hr_WHONDRS-SW48-000098_B_bin.30]